MGAVVSGFSKFPIIADESSSPGCAITFKLDKNIKQNTIIFSALFFMFSIFVYLGLLDYFFGDFTSIGCSNFY